MIKEIYLVHHSHTDIGYTDYQERIIFNQVNIIRTLKDKMVPGFKWNCETLFCVEQFLKEADEAEKKTFFELVRSSRVGISTSYLNFTDLVDIPHLTERVKSILSILEKEGIHPDSAMIADINGLSMGYLDYLIDCGTKFLFTNVHCHHGMYPLGQNQRPFFWKSMKSGRSLLVWNGEHYNLGNALGFTYTKRANFMTENYFGERLYDDAVSNCAENVERYIKELLDSGYDKDFIISSVSGVFSDNAPAEPKIAAMAKSVEEKLGNRVKIRMVTLSELYSLINEKCSDAPVYEGDFTDWWSYGVGSNPYAVKHYLEAVRTERKSEIFASAFGLDISKDKESYTDNALLFAEHTFGHSATVSDSAETMVKNLEFRKNSYASKANEAANKALLKVVKAAGDCLTYYEREGRVKAINKGDEKLIPVQFYIECWPYDLFEVENEKTGEKMICQTSAHPRGALVSFYDSFAKGEEKVYRYKEVKKPVERINSRVAYSGSERVRDIINDYDSVTYKLPYGIENDYFSIKWENGGTITSVYDKVSKRELSGEGEFALFTPVYETTENRSDLYEERRRLGRNIRGQHAKRFIATIEGVESSEIGAVFNRAVLNLALEGCRKLQLVITLYNRVPRIELSLKVFKDLCLDPESLFLPLSLKGMSSLYFNKGGEYFRPGVDQLPLTCMEYYLLTDGLVYKVGDETYSVALKDAPMVYTGVMKHHPVQLCQRKVEDNLRPIYSWIMNNNWETNFPLDLSGITEFRYVIEKGGSSIDESFAKLKDDQSDYLVVMLG